MANDRKNLTVRLELADYDSICAVADALGMSINELATSIIRRYLDGKKSEVQRLKEMKQAEDERRKATQRKAASIWAGADETSSATAQVDGEISAGDD